MIRKTSKEWQPLLLEHSGLVVLDPDGWDRSDWNYSYNEEEITADEFINRVGSSTCNFPSNPHVFSELRLEAKKWTGLYNRYEVKKTNGKPIGESIVLEFKDPIARVGIEAWAEAMRIAGFVSCAVDVEKKLYKYESMPPTRDFL